MTAPIWRCAAGCETPVGDTDDFAQRADRLSRTRAGTAPASLLKLAGLCIVWPALLASANHVEDQPHR